MENRHTNDKANKSWFNLNLIDFISMLKSTLLLCILNFRNAPINAPSLTMRWMFPFEKRRVILITLYEYLASEICIWVSHAFGRFLCHVLMTFRALTYILKYYHTEWIQKLNRVELTLVDRFIKTVYIYQVDNLNLYIFQWQAVWFILLPRVEHEQGKIEKIRMHEPNYVLMFLFQHISCHYLDLLSNYTYVMLVEFLRLTICQFM